MPGEVNLSTLFGGLLVLSRLAGIFAFVPFGMLRSGPDAARVLLALLTTIALFPRWPDVSSEQTPGSLAVLILAEASFGLLVGLLVAFLLESFAFAAQLIALQAGYAYASTIDPTNQTDSGVLPMLINSITLLSMVSLGLDRQLIRVFARSLDLFPPGQALLPARAIDTVQHFGAAIFSTGLSLALPVIAVLLMTDLVLAVLSRTQSHLQLLTLAFPAKMMLALLTLGLTAFSLPYLCQRELHHWEKALSALRK